MTDDGWRMRNDAAGSCGKQWKKKRRGGGRMVNDERWTDTYATARMKDRRERMIQNKNSGMVLRCYRRTEGRLGGRTEGCREEETKRGKTTNKGVE